MPRAKSRNGSSRGNGSDLPMLVNLRFVKALDHVLRQHILLATVAGEVSPSELAEALGEGLSQVSYHVKVLREDCDGIIEETRTEPRRGAVEHYYRATANTLLPAKSWRRLKKGLRCSRRRGPGKRPVRRARGGAAGRKAAGHPRPHHPDPARSRRGGAAQSRRDRGAGDQRSRRRATGRRQARRERRRHVGRLLLRAFRIRGSVESGQPWRDERRRPSRQGQSCRQKQREGEKEVGRRLCIAGLGISKSRPANVRRQREVDMRRNAAWPNFDVEKVEAVVLEVAAELHPELLAGDRLAQKIASDPHDSRELDTATQAIHNLRELGLFTERDDELVEPTPAALRAVALLLG